MATAMEETRVLEEELTCPVCLDLYREPHLLPCGHNFCLQCLWKLKSRSEFGCLRCPECRESYRYSTQWQKNFKLSNIADSFRNRNRAPWPSQSPPGPSFRTITDDSAKRSTAVKTCLKCEVSMCSEHVQQHLELPAFRDHLLVKPLSDMRKGKCKTHDEMFQYYCMDKHKFLCNTCTLEGEHSRHTIKTLKNTMTDLRESLDTQLQKANRKIRILAEYVQEQNDADRHNKDFLEGIDKLVDTLRRILMTRLDIFLSSLSACAHAYEREKSLGIQQDLARAEEDRNRLRDVHAGIEQLQQENDPCQFIKAYMSSAKRYRRLLKRTLFHSFPVTMNTEVIEERLEEKLIDFMSDLRGHFIFFTNAIRGCDMIDDETYEDVEEDDSDESDSSDEDEEQEEDMREVEDKGEHSRFTFDLTSEEDEVDE